MEDVVEAIVVAEVVVVEEEDDVGDVEVEVEELAIDVVVAEELAIDVVVVEELAVDVDVGAGGRTGVGAGGRTAVGVGGRADVGGDGVTCVTCDGKGGVVGVGVAVEVVFKEGVVDAGVFFAEDVAKFCLFECVFFAKESCVVFSSTTEMRRFEIIGQTD